MVFSRAEKQTFATPAQRGEHVIDRYRDRDRRAWAFALTRIFTTKLCSLRPRSDEIDLVGVLCSAGDNDLPSRNL